MAFAAEIFPGFPISLGGMALSSGTYKNTGGSTGGNIDTGLGLVYVVILQPKGSAVSANQPVVNETPPMAGNAVTIVTSADEEGTWIAIGL